MFFSAMTKQHVDVPADDQSAVPGFNDQKDLGMTEETQIPENATSEEVERMQRDQRVIAQYRENLAHNMRRFRARERWTQTDLGKAIGSSQGQIAFLEREKHNVGLGILTKLATVFNVEPMVLISPPDDLDHYFRRRGLKRPDDSVSAESSFLHPTQVISKVQKSASERTSEEKLLESQTFSTSPLGKPAGGPASMEAPLGSPGDPLDLVVMARIVGAAYRRIESLRHKHGSVPMTRAMLNSVLAAVLNASHDTDTDCDKDRAPLPEVDQ